MLEAEESDSSGLGWYRKLWCDSRVPQQETGQQQEALRLCRKEAAWGPTEELKTHSEAGKSVAEAEVRLPRFREEQKLEAGRA